MIQAFLMELLMFSDCGTEMVKTLYWLEFKHDTKYTYYLGM